MRYPHIQHAELAPMVCSVPEPPSLGSVGEHLPCLSAGTTKTPVQRINKNFWVVLGKEFFGKVSNAEWWYELFFFSTDEIVVNEWWLRAELTIPVSSA